MSDPLSLLLQHPAFADIDQCTRDLLSERQQIYSFQTGATLSTPAAIGSEILFLLSGTARLLIRLNDDQLFTSEKLVQSSFVGLASLLRVHPCEHVIASGTGTALAIPDDLIILLYTKSASFREWCRKTVFAAELGDLISHTGLVDHSTPNLHSHIQDLLSVLRPNVTVSNSSLEQAGGTLSFCSSANIRDLSVNTIVTEPHQLFEAAPPFGARFLHIPRALFLGSVKQSEHLPQDLEPRQADLPTLTTAPTPTSLDLGLPNKNRPKLLRANGEIREALACLQMLSSLLNLPFRRDSIEKSLADFITKGKRIDLQIFAAISSALGLHVSLVSTAASQGNRLLVPALLFVQDRPALVYASNSAGLFLASPSAGFKQVGVDELPTVFPDGIQMLFFERRQITQTSTFGFTWFWPLLKRYKNIFIQIFVASFVVQLFSLANPLLIQVIIDKVISQRSLDTLQVLGAALVVVTLLEGIISSLRTFLFSQTTNRIDLRLGSEVIDHLLRLPLSYFDRRPVGELSSRLSELEKIREFITGQGLTSLLDAVFSIVYIVVMFMYSSLLSFIALSVLPVQILITLAGAPLFRRQFRETAQRNARTQSHLVEILSGIQTVKAQNVETVSRWKWQNLYSSYIEQSFKKTITATSLSQTSQILQKLSQLLVLWIGASLVLEGQLSLGQLIAFRIISGYVTLPLLRLSGIWQSIQELKISFERLADVIDTPEESSDLDKSKIHMPTLTGDVRFDNVSFSFDTQKQLALSDIRLHVSPGTFVGVVGPSGSGKSTLTKLLSRLYSPTKGRVYVDNLDIDKIELYSLRRQIGIVPQDPLLFSGSISDNLSLIVPDASSEEIVEAAKLACAHEFIMSMPDGYSSYVGERGSNLSGGQRQRLALARTLISKPRLLVLDEATSALDYDTERRVCENLISHLKDCTVFFVTHRLSTVKRSDLIVMMKDGKIVEEGPHDKLFANRSFYYSLYSQQDSV